MSHSNGRAAEGGISVKKREPVKVVPSGMPPKGLYMLSNLDQVFPYPIKIVYAYKGNGTNITNHGEILRTSLAEILDYYYPFAGCLERTWDGKMMVNCTGDGVSFVEAFSEDDMEVLGDVSLIDPLRERNLIHFNETAQNILQVPPLTVQVTRFKCGGIVLGVAFNHIFVDGKAFTDFIRSWSRVARGLPLSVPPFLDRSIFSPRHPPKIEIPHPEFAKTKNPLPSLNSQNQEATYETLCFTQNTLRQMRKSVIQDDYHQFSNSTPPTSFELISALMWLCWTKASKVSPVSTTKLLTAIDGRPKFRQPTPECYFGNDIAWSCAQCKTAELMSKPLGFALRKVKNAIKEVDEDYIRSEIDYHEVTRKGLDFENSLVITKWSRLPFCEANFGWGEPMHVAPTSIGDNLAIVFSKEKDSGSIAVLLRLPASQMEVFRGHVQKLIKDYDQ
nr:alcohol acyltransferase 2 [Jasminum sambac]